MMFKNLKTGNIVTASAEDTIELMQRSSIYEAVDTPEAPAEDALTPNIEGESDFPAADENVAEDGPKPKSKGKKATKADE